MNLARCRREAQSHTVERPRAAVWNESLMSVTCSYRPKLFCNRPGLVRLHVAGVQRCLSFYEQYVALRLRDRIVSNPFWDHKHLAFVELNCFTFHLYAKVALENIEEFVFIPMAVPRQRS